MAKRFVWCNRGNSESVDCVVLTQSNFKTLCKSKFAGFLVLRRGSR